MIYFIYFNNQYEFMKDVKQTSLSSMSSPERPAPYKSNRLLPLVL